MLKRIFLILLIVISIFLNFSDNLLVCADAIVSSNTDVNEYMIYDDNFNLLFVKNGVDVGDGYLSDDYNYYEITYVDNDTKKGIAKFVRHIDGPRVDKYYGPTPIKIESRVICMYMTHNDESYVPTDGTESVYGNGGIKDVALALKSQLENHLIDVYFDDTLHIPHDTNAYSRSLKTAKKLIDEYNPDAIFDIHRDGASRSYYVTNVNGVDRGRVRMVVGKANPNMELNEDFALYLMSVGKEMYPWLFTDIYYAKGHYNQNLNGKAILFEMGSHLVEKELEVATTKELADVISTALYKTTVNIDSGDLTINGVENENEITVNNLIDQKQSTSSNVLGVCVAIVLISCVCVYAFFVFFNNVLKLQEKRK